MPMQDSPLVHSRIIDGPITPPIETDALAGADLSHTRDGTVGATLRFEGIVREIEPNPQQANTQQRLLALDYQTYDPMAERELEALARRIALEHQLRSLITLHSRGRVRVGEISFVLTIASAHRAEALRAMTDFIDRLKQDVPIWKHPVWASPTK